MRVRCPHCEQWALIKKTHRISNAITDAYCRCDNEDCQAGFIVTVAHKHDTQPPIKNQQALLKEMIGSLSDQERKELIANLVS